ncbi:o-succinylbenzoate synthase [soil metagenome]
MSLNGNYKKYSLQFKFTVGTSRGFLQNKNSYIISVWDDKNPAIRGIGESGPFPKLSLDDRPDLENAIQEALLKLQSYSVPDNVNDIFEITNTIVNREFPSLRFGLETSLLDLYRGGRKILFPNNFTKGLEAIPINGLIWMGNPEFMLKQVKDKVKEGFRCLKIKIGALDFDKECEILDVIRNDYSPEDIELRVDANGAFSPDKALYKLKVLSAFNIHSIEQPVMPGQKDLLRALCHESPIPIALDEELIGIFGQQQKTEHLCYIKPAFIILKPTLLGGFEEIMSWIEIAEKLNIGWWVTSALESNIGLNAISQFAANYVLKLPQGLGTGQLYHNNFNSPLTVAKGELKYDIDKEWKINI